MCFCLSSSVNSSGFPWFFSVLKVVSFRPTCKTEIIFLPKNSIFIIKTVKTVTLLSEYAKNWSAFNAVEKIIVCYENNCCCVQQRLFVKIKTKGYCYSDKTRFRKSYPCEFLRGRSTIPFMYNQSYALFPMCVRGCIWVRS